MKSVLHTQRPRAPLERSNAFERLPLQRQDRQLVSCDPTLAPLTEPYPSSCGRPPAPTPPLWADFACFQEAIEAPQVQAALGVDALDLAQRRAAYNVYCITREHDELAVAVLGRIARTANSSVCEPVRVGLDDIVFSNFGRTPAPCIHAEPAPPGAPAYPETGATLHMGSNAQWSLLGNVCFLLAVMQAGRPVFTASGTDGESLLHPVRGLSVLGLEYALLLASGYQYVRATGGDGQAWCEGFRCCDDRFRVQPTLASCAQAIVQARADPPAFVQRMRELTGSPASPGASRPSP